MKFLSVLKKDFRTNKFLIFFKFIQATMEQLFAQMDVYNDSAERLVKEHEWSSEHWLKWYKIYKQKDERSSLKALRIAVILSTLEVCKTGRVHKN